MVSNADTTAFRAWWAEIRAMLSAVGLVQTSDTGQLDPLTVSKPVGGNTDAGYEIWRFDDALQAVAPIFIKLSPGTNTNVQTPRVRAQCGMATDGAGNFVGPATQIFHRSDNQSVASTSTPYVSRACCVPGVFWIYFKDGAMSGGGNTFFHLMVERTVDNAGAPTPLGFIVKTRLNQSAGSQFASQSYRFLFPAAVSGLNDSASNVCFVPGNLTDSKTDPATGGPGLKPQVFLHWYAMPKQMPTIGMGTYLTGDAAANVEFDLALVGTTPRHYITVGQTTFGVASNANSSAACLIWED